MTHRLNLIIAMLCMALLPAMGQNQRKEFVLNKDNNFKQKERLSFCNLTVSAKPSHDNESADIEITIDNTSDGALILFQDSQGWSGVKNIYSPKIKAVNKEAEKNFERDGILGYRNLDYITVYDCNENKPLEFKRRLVAERDNGPIEIELPVYTGLVKSRNKNSQQINEVRLNGLERLSMTIIVELGPDEEFEALKQQCEEFVAKMQDIPCFCTNKNHKPDVKGDAEMQLQALYNKIEEVSSQKQAKTDDESVTVPYDELIKKINDAFAAVEEKDCGNHGSKSSSTRQDDPKKPKTRQCSQCGRDLPLSKFKNGKRYLKTCSDCRNDLPAPTKKTCKNNIIPALESILKDVNSGKKTNALSKADRLAQEAKGLPDYNTFKDKIARIRNNISRKVK